MRNWLGIARALLCLLVGHASVTSVNDWVQGVLGPDAWNYSAQDLGTPVVPITDSGRNPYKGVHPSELEAPVAQALRYAHGYVGVHTLYIGGWLLWCAATAEPESALHWQIPLSLVAFEAGAYANALGYFDRDTMGHPRCKNFWHWRGRWGDHPRRAGRETGAKFPTSTVFHSFRPTFGRAIIPRSGLGAWMLFLQARARNAHVVSPVSRPGGETTRTTTTRAPATASTRLQRARPREARSAPRRALGDPSEDRPARSSRATFGRRSSSRPSTSAWRA